MATARQFSVLYNRVAKICQDESTDGKNDAKEAINTVIKELSREFKLPNLFKGEGNTIFVTPSASIGPQFLTLATDVSKLENVYYIENFSNIRTLTEITSDEEWMEKTDINTSGDPVYYRDWQPEGTIGNLIEIWPSPNAGWQSKANGKLYYTYWAQLAQLSADGDVPAISYDLDTVLVNGGVLEMARTQGDTTLINLYVGKYEDDKGEIRAWLIKQRKNDGQLEPDNPMGVFGIDSGDHGYKL